MLEASNVCELGESSSATVDEVEVVSKAEVDVVGRGSYMIDPIQVDVWVVVHVVFCAWPGMAPCCDECTLVDCIACEDGNTVVYPVEVTVTVFLGRCSPNVQKDIGAVSTALCVEDVSGSHGSNLNDAALEMMGKLSLTVEDTMLDVGGSSVESSTRSENGNVVMPSTGGRDNEELPAAGS